MHWSRLLSATIMAALLVGGLWAPAAEAQKSTIPNGAGEIRKDRKWWTNQLRMARESGARTLHELQAAPVDESSPVDENLLQNARNTYILIRSAKAGIEIYRGEQKFADPVLDLVLRNVNEAWVLARTPVDRASWRMPRAEYLSLSIQELSRSMRLLDQTLIILP
jgi:hypothetical protein